MTQISDQHAGQRTRTAASRFLPRFSPTHGPARRRTGRDPGPPPPRHRREPAAGGRPAPGSCMFRRLDACSGWVSSTVGQAVPRLSTPAFRFGACRTSPATPTRAPPGGTAGPGTTSTGTPPTPSPAASAADPSPSSTTALCHAIGGVRDVVLYTAHVPHAMCEICCEPECLTNDRSRYAARVL